jgi:hypothetical protein
MVCWRIIHRNESVAASAVNPNPHDLADFGIHADSSTAIACSNFAPESSYVVGSDVVVGAVGLDALKEKVSAARR